MAMNTDVTINGSKYDVEDRPTTAPSYQSATVIKYMGSRANLSSSLPGSLRNFTLSKTGANFLTSPTTTSHGLVSLVDTSSMTTMSSVQSIDGERIINE